MYSPGIVVVRLDEAKRWKAEAVVADIIVNSVQKLASAETPKVVREEE